MLLHRLVTNVQFGRIRLLVPFFFFGESLLAALFAPSGDLRVVDLAAAALLVLGGAWPLPVALGEAGLLVVGSAVPGTATAAVSLLASLALLELAIRKPLRQSMAGALVLSAAYFAASYFIGRPYGHGGFGSAPVMLLLGFGVDGGVVIPMLLGLWLRLVLLRLTERRDRDLRRVRQAERTEIARELHDLVAHHVASMALRVGVARAVVPDVDPRIGTVLDDVHSSATTALADLRRLVGVLRDPSGTTSRLTHVNPADLPAAVTEAIDRAGVEVSRQVDPAIATIDSARGLAVLRVVQEGLTNVAKHAAGAHATVRVEVVGGDVLVDVTDDGGVPDPVTEAGYGLVGLRERVEMLGGTLSAGPCDGGWQLRVTLPEPS